MTLIVSILLLWPVTSATAQENPNVGIIFSQEEQAVLFPGIGKGFSHKGCFYYWLGDGHSDCVEMILSQEEGIFVWRSPVSPAGDKIIYQSRKSGEQVVLFPQTGERFSYDGCFYYWLGGDHFSCGDDRVFTVQTNPYKVVDVEYQQSNAANVDLKQLLDEADQVYALMYQQQLWLIRTDQPPHLISGVGTIRTIIDQYPQAQIVRTIPGYEMETRVISPDQRYYYNRDKTALTIYQTADDKPVTEFFIDYQQKTTFLLSPDYTEDPQEYLSFVTWAADSSGVFFSTQYFGPYNRGKKKEEVLKLNVPPAVAPLTQPRWRCDPSGGVACFHDLRHVSMLNENEGWASSTGPDQRLLLHFTTSPETITPTWQISYSDDYLAPKTLRTDTVFMLNEGNGWAVGEKGQIWQIVDHERKLVDSPTDNHLYDLVMLSPDEGWAVGEQVTLLHYHNQRWSTAPFVRSQEANLLDLQALQKEFWSTLARPNDYQPWYPTLYAIQMISPDEGWAVGEAIFHYHEEQWQEVPESYKFPPLFALDMVSSDEGWAVGKAGALVHYQQGQWQEVEPLTTNSLESIDLVSPTHGWAVGRNSYHAALRSRAMVAV